MFNLSLMNIYERPNTYRKYIYISCVFGVYGFLLQTRNSIPSNGGCLQYEEVECEKEKPIMRVSSIMMANQLQSAKATTNAR